MGSSAEVFAQLVVRTEQMDAMMGEWDLEIASAKLVGTVGLVKRSSNFGRPIGASVGHVACLSERRVATTNARIFKSSLL
jgi:hypothetical protein